MPDGLTLEQLRAAPAPKARGLSLDELRAAPAAGPDDGSSVRDKFIAYQERNFGKPPAPEFKEPVVKGYSGRVANAWHSTMDEPIRAAEEEGANATRNLGDLNPVNIIGGATPPSRARDELGSIASSVAKTATIPFAPVGTLLDRTLGRPSEEAPVEGVGPNADQFARRALREGIDYVPNLGMAVAHAPGIKQGTEALLGAKGPEAIGTLLPFVAGAAGKPIMRGLGRLDEAMTRPRTLAPHAAEVPPARPPRVAPVRAEVAPVSIEAPRPGVSLAELRAMPETPKPRLAPRRAVAVEAPAAAPEATLPPPAAAPSAEPVLRATRPIPDADAPSVKSILVGAPDSVKAPTGKPGIEVHPSDADGFTYATFRDADGVVRGVASHSTEIPTHKANINVAVDPAFQRQGVATSLYDALEKSGVPVRDVSGTQGVTAAGKGFTEAWKSPKPAPAAAPEAPQGVPAKATAADSVPAADLPGVADQGALRPLSNAEVRDMYPDAPAKIPPEYGTRYMPPEGRVVYDRGIELYRRTPMEQREAVERRLSRENGDEFVGWRDARQAGRRAPREGPTLGEPPTPRLKPFLGRPGGSEAGALGLPSMRPIPDALPTGTPAEHAAVAGVKERIRYGEEPTEPILKRIGNAAKNAEAKLVRREAPIRRFERGVAGTEEPTGVTAQAKFAQGSSAVAAENVVQHGILNERDVPKVEEALKKVVKAGRPTSDVAAYASAKRAVTDYEPNKLESGFDPAEAKATVDLYEKNHPEVVAAADALKDVNVALREDLMDADRWAPARRKALEDRNKYPVEFARDFGDAAQADTNQPPGRSSAMPGPTMKKRLGGKQPIRDPLVRFQENVRRMIAGADQARVKHAFLDTIARDPAAAAEWVEQITPAQAKATIPDFDAIASAINPTAVPENWGATFDAWDKANAAGIIPDGKGGLLRVKDRALMDAIAGGDMTALEAKLLDVPIVGKAMKGAKAITSVQRSGITSLSPSFPIMNAIRDAATYPLQASKYPNDFKVGMNYARGIYHALHSEFAKLAGVVKIHPETPINQLARRARLQTFSQVDTVKNAPRNLARMDEGFARYYVKRPHRLAADTVRGGLTVWKDVNSIVEMGPRYAGILNELDAVGWKPGDPITRDLLVRLGNAGQEATVNFRLGGEVTKAANRYLYNFVNPATQGIEQLRQSAQANKATFARRVAMYYVAPAVGAWYWWHSDDKRKAAWDRMTPWRRAQANVPLTDEDGNVYPLSLPLPQEAGVFYTGTIAAMDKLHDEGVPAETLWEAVKRGLPVDAPLHPSAIQPIAEVKQGFSDFSGRPINPQSMEGGEKIAPWEVAQPYNGKTARWLSRFLFDISGGHSEVTAAEVEHLFGGYGGTVTRDVSRAVPTGKTERTDRPFIGRLTPRMSESRFTDDYYEQRSKYEGQVNLARAMRRTNPESAKKLRLPKGIAGNIAKIDTALKIMRDRYREAPETGKPRLAQRMDFLAKRGLRLLSSAGIGDAKIIGKQALAEPQAAPR